VDPHILEALGNDQNTKVPIVQNNKKESTKNQTGADHEAPAHEAVSIAETEGIEYAGVASVESNAARADDAELTTGNNDDANDVFINAPEVRVSLFCNRWPQADLSVREGRRDYLIDNRRW
jgi:hypothetical protein